MDEFVKLFLTGKRAENMARFLRTVNILGAVGALLTIVPFILAFVTEEPSLPLVAVISVLGVLLGAVSVILKQYKTAYVRGLAELQHAANELELNGEERKIYAKLYAAWTETLGKRKPFGILAAILSLLGYVVLMTVAIVCAVLPVPQVLMFAATVIFCILAVVPTVIEVTAEGRARTALYERAEGEIEEIKRKKLGLSEARIASESENARAYSSVPLSVMMFLKEDTERAEFHFVAKRSGVASFILGFAIGFAVIVSCFDGLWERLGPTLSWLLAGVFFVVVLAVFFVYLFPLERRKKEIYKRNFEKLTGSETDALRKQLQAAWIRLQKSGNIMFFTALAVSVFAGVILGLVGYFTVEGTVLAESIGSCIMCFLIPAAILSVIIWAVMFFVYRRKVRPAEILLKEKIREGRENERNG